MSRAEDNPRSILSCQAENEKTDFDYNGCPAYVGAPFLSSLSQYMKNIGKKYNHHEFIYKKLFL
jgi:hypothetical protein